MGWDGLVDESIDVTTFIFYAIEIVRDNVNFYHHVEFSSYRYGTGVEFAHMQNANSDLRILCQTKQQTTRVPPQSGTSDYFLTFYV